MLSEKIVMKIEILILVNETVSAGDIRSRKLLIEKLLFDALASSNHYYCCKVLIMMGQHIWNKSNISHDKSAPRCQKGFDLLLRVGMMSVGTISLHFANFLQNIHCDGTLVCLCTQFLKVRSLQIQKLQPFL